MPVWQTVHAYMYGGLYTYTCIADCTLYLYGGLCMYTCMTDYTFLTVCLTVHVCLYGRLYVYACMAVCLLPACKSVVKLIGLLLNTL